MRLKKCPFCCSNDLYVTLNELHLNEFVRCKSCGARGPVSINPIKDWNKRLRRAKTVTQLAKKATQLIQLRARLEETDQNGYGKCVSCGEVKEWCQLNGGHFEAKGRTYNAASVDRNNVHNQCVFCNNGKSGASAGYGIYMLERYGKAEIERIFLLSKQQGTREMFEASIERDRKICRELAKTKNFKVNIP